jgi:hypothetical protein
VTFAELFHAACEVDPSDSIAVDVEAWRHVHPPTRPAKTLGWSIWSSKLANHFHGETPEEALTAYMRAAGPSAAQVTPAALALVDDAKQLRTVDDYQCHGVVLPIANSAPLEASYPISGAAGPPDRPSS